ncbi:MAG TPA: S8 family serine peptidase [Actinocrinis sp.]|nr:S8 family serine peptidase [Actinocrinis sp.]
MSLIIAPSAQAQSSQWALTYLQSSQVSAISTGTGVTVAVIDSGVQSVPDLSSALLPGADFSTSSSSSGNGQSDLDGHGTGIAALIAGDGTSLSGLAPGAKILPVKDTTGQILFPASVVAAIDFAVANHVQVINFSQKISTTPYPTIAAAIAAAESANIVVIAGSGNDGTAQVDYPAAYPGVVAVGATDQSGAVWPDSNTGSQVSLTAPGVSVDVENETGLTGPSNGTSISTAYVSAAAALIRSLHPTWTAGQVISDLITTAKPGPGQSAGQRSDSYGYGVVNPLAALQAAEPAQTANPLLPKAAPTTQPRNGPSAPTVAQDPGTTSGSSNTGLYFAIAAVALVLIIIVLVLRTRRQADRP